MKPPGECVFCSLMMDGETAVIMEDEDTFCFLDKSPLFHGHCLIVPKQHVAHLSDADSRLLAKMISNAKLISEAMERALGAGGSFLAINNKISQSVPHIHLHVVPRTKGDGLKGFFWPRKKYRDFEHMLEVAAMLKKAL